LYFSGWAEQLGIAIATDRAYQTAAGFVLDRVGHLPEMAENSTTRAGSSRSSVSMTAIDKFLARRASNPPRRAKA
jgi:hypothetical protein